MNYDPEEYIARVNKDPCTSVRILLLALYTVLQNEVPKCWPAEDDGVIVYFWILVANFAESELKS